MLPIYDHNGNVTGYVRRTRIIAMKAGPVVMMCPSGPGLEIGQVIRIVSLPSQANLDTITFEIIS
jgi:hypothetical protein